MPGPLAGIRVIDCSAIVSGPFATMMLADQGADVIKVEPPGIGDLMRIGPFRRGNLSAFYLNCNRGKRAVCIDLQKPEGRDVLLDLVRSADVFVQNFRPGAVERLGIAEPDLRKLNPELLYVSISGYGETGPYAKRRVYDPIIQGLTGHVAIQKHPEFPIPDLVRNVVADKASAMWVSQAVCAALFARERGAGGQHIRLPMLDASLYFFWPDGMMGHTLQPGGEIGLPGPALYDLYRITETADGQLIYWAASDAEMHALYRALAHPEWVDDPRYGSLQGRYVPENRERLGEMILNEFRKWNTEEILARMAAEGVPVGPVLSLDQIPDDPQIRHNECVVAREHPAAGPMHEPRQPVRYARTQPELGQPAPLHGQHTDEVLGELGYDAARRAALRERKVIV
jgi:crotonobetainyl-CoA:carnitine CoA-transferase CaiB-like acyl-CoA transferase